MEAQRAREPETYQGYNNVLFIILASAAGVCFVLTAQQLFLAANLPIMIITYAVLVRAAGPCPPTPFPLALTPNAPLSFFFASLATAAVCRRRGDHLHAAVHDAQRARRHPQGVCADPAIPRLARTFRRFLFPR